ncbi:MAG: hypothetical protein IKK67_09815 [Bacteroidaceae bacterium]|nr:hypothetical protein [Bacteroidaceae bacterium]
MKNIFVLVIVFLYSILSFSQNAVNIYTLSDGAIDVNTDFQAKSNIGNSTGITPYKEIGTVSFVANSRNYTLSVLNYNGWETDGGDFRVIRLYEKNQSILEFIDEEAWIGKKVEDEYQATPFSAYKDDVVKHAVYNDHCIVYPLEDGVTALLFEGFSWSSQVPLLTIVVIKDGNAKVVFNQSWAVEAFNAHSKGFELILIDYFQEEYDNNWHPDRHRIYTTSDGTMRFEKVN